MIVEKKIQTFNPTEFENLKPEIEARFINDIAGAESVCGLKILYAETVGINLERQQEDAFLFGESFESENPQHVPAILQEKLCEVGMAIKDIQDQFGNSAGSTAVLAHYSPDQILTIANCGDSRATLLFYKKDSITAYKALTRDHEPSDILEKALIEDAGGIVFKNRLYRSKESRSSLAVSRSFGDRKYQNLINFEPEIFQYDIANILKEVNQELPEEESVQVFLMVSCDGLYTKIADKRINEKFYLKALVEWQENQNNEQQKWRGNIASYMQDYALEFGSTDNITLCFTDITKSPQSSVVIGVFDGHSGKEVSQTLVQELGRSLLKEGGKKFIHPEDAKSLFEQSNPATEVQVIEFENVKEKESAEISETR